MSGRIQHERDRAEGLGSARQAVRYQNQDFWALREECLQNGTVFLDPLFPAEPGSLGFKELGPLSTKTRGVEWRRPTVRTGTGPGIEDVSVTQLFSDWLDRSCRRSRGSLWAEPPGPTSARGRWVSYHANLTTSTPHSATWSGSGPGNVYRTQTRSRTLLVLILLGFLY